MTNFQDLSSALHVAIESTIAALRPPVMGAPLPEATRASLQARLDWLLEKEKLLFTADHPARVKSDDERRAEAAAKTLEHLNYSWRGGELWTPPLGARPESLDTPTPWYPDDSGEWVEVPDDCITCPVGENTSVEALVCEERATRRYLRSVRPALDWQWGLAKGKADRIVAYKVVKP